MQCFFHPLRNGDREWNGNICIYEKCNSLSQAGQQLVTPGCDDHNVHIVLCVSFPFTAAESNQDYQSGQWFKCHKIFLRNFVYCIEFYSH